MIDKAKVARSFSRSASTYNTAAYLQRQVGERLLSLLPRAGGTVEGVTLDLGCGTGYFSEALTRQFPGSGYLAIDIALGMLHYCQRQQDQEKAGQKQWERNANKRPRTEARKLLCADAEQLPLANGIVAVVYSNLVFQWCNDLPGLLTELYRIMVPGGWVAFSTFGPRTLIELKQAWARVDNLVHVNHFIGGDNWRQAIESSGFSVACSTVQMEVLRYDLVQQLLRELKQLGAHNVNEGQRQGLTGRRRMQALFEAYQPFCHDGHYLATYEVLYWVLRKA